MSAAVDIEDLVDRLRRVDDPREERGVRHSLVDVLFIALVAMVSGADDAEAMQDYGEANAEWFAEFLELRHGIPSQDTFLRVFALLSTATVERLFLDWVHGLRTVWEGGHVARLRGQGDPNGQRMAGLGGARSGAGEGGGEGQ